LERSASGTGTEIRAANIRWDPLSERPNAPKGTSLGTGKVGPPGWGES